MAKRTKNMIVNNESEDIRLNKYLSDAGVCSRREADKLIEEGKVKVDGTIAEMGTRIRRGQLVTLNDKVVKKEEHLILIAYNKPRGIVCTTDHKEPNNIIDYLNYGKRIYPIGRLDKDSEGLILLTNTGDIVNKILRAGNKHEKEYIVKVNKPITMEFLKGMSSGVPILDTVTKPCKITALDKYTFQIILTQGLNRQIRRMCEYFDYKVLELQRIRIMNINLGRLKVGDYRNVTENEIKDLNELIRESSNSPIIEENEEFQIDDDFWNSKEGNRTHFEKKKTYDKKNNRENHAEKGKSVRKKNNSFSKSYNTLDENKKSKNTNGNTRNINYKSKDDTYKNLKSKNDTTKNMKSNENTAKYVKSEEHKDSHLRNDFNHDFSKKNTPANKSRNKSSEEKDLQYTKRTQKILSKKKIESNKNAFKTIVRGNKTKR